MVPLIVQLDRFHVAVRRVRFFRMFTWLLRVLLALGFVLAGMIKILGIPFIKSSFPAGSVKDFFDSLHNAGLLYNFIGVCQVVAAVLLLVPATATLGALVYLPIISGIEVMTVTMPFRGTWVITSLMLLGVIYLLAWDWDRLKHILVSPDRRCMSVGTDNPVGVGSFSRSGSEQLR